MTTKYVQAPEMTLQSSISAVATSCVLTGMVDLSGVPLVQTDFGDVGYGTFEPNTAREEAVSFVITSNPSGTATLTITRGLRGKAPYGTGGTGFIHNAGAKFVLSNNPDLLNKLTAKDNDEVVEGSWHFPETPVHNLNPVTKKHFDDTGVKLTGNQTIAGVKTFSASPKVPASTANDEAVRRDEVVRLAGNQTVAGVKTFSSSPVVPTAVNPTEAVNKSQMESYIANESGDIKASDTAFGTTKLDVPADVPADPKALTATANRVAALSGGGDFGTPSTSNKFVTEQILPKVVVFNSSGTWTKDPALKYARVQAWGGGGGGARVTNFHSAGGGGGGEYREAFLPASALGSTVTVTVGSGGVGATTQGVGGDGQQTTFGSHLSANGGGGGQFNAADGNIGAAAGGIWSEAGASPIGRDTYRGGDGGNVTSSTGTVGQSAAWGGGGGGAADSPTIHAGGISLNGGAGGNGGNSTTPPTNGQQPGGGGGGGATANGGNGGAGRIIVTEYYF